jgi:hypothetical protein
MSSSPYQSAFDVLVIAKRLEASLGGVTRSELHLLAYVACLLSVYKGYPASDWGYTFIRSNWGSPFAAAIEDRVTNLEVAGLVVSRGQLIAVSESGSEMLSVIREASEHSWRSGFLDAAASSALAIPLGSIRGALHQEPGSRKAAIHVGPQELIRDQADPELYEQFEGVTEVVGPNVSDLLVPSVVWLAYLDELNRQSLAATE